MPECYPKMTPVNGTHCRIEYEDCFRGLKPDHEAWLFLDRLNEGGQKFSSSISNNTVNIQNVCWEYKHIFLYINADIENLVDFSYIPSLSLCSDDTDVMVYIGVGLSAAVVFVICHLASRMAGCFA